MGEERKASNGFLLQVEETTGLGDGQKIETEMAKEVGIKIFRAYNDDSMCTKDGCNGLQRGSRRGTMQAAKTWTWKTSSSVLRAIRNTKQGRTSPEPVVEFTC